MPLYEYRCEDCGDTIEVIQKFSDTPLSLCKACGGSLERLLSPPTIQFKGSGWYVTDYPRNDGKDDSSKEKSSLKESSAKTVKEKAKSASDSKSASGSGKSDSKK
ncbi:MAG: zinc ribbon domain-containing protein [Acidobacteria bacterium]|nr:zinc ribbon domain-containing protein [Acidobacteriota bacterium]